VRLGPSWKGKTTDHGNTASPARQQPLLQCAKQRRSTRGGHDKTQRDTYQTRVLVEYRIGWHYPIRPTLNHQVVFYLSSPTLSTRFFLKQQLLRLHLRYSTPSLSSPSCHLPKPDLGRPTLFDAWHASPKPPDRYVQRTADHDPSLHPIRLPVLLWL
jgi:hypothetical protein